MNRPHVSQPHAQAPKRGKGTVLVVAVLLATAIGAAGGVWLLRGAMSRESDVGDLRELANVQSMLRPLDACDIHYEGQVRKGNVTHTQHVFVKACTKGAEYSVHVPVEVRPNLAFTLRRSSQTSAYEILVEKERVPLPMLVSGLEAYARVLVEQYPARLHVQRAEAEKASQDQAGRQRADEARKARSKDSYPSK